ncbi:MAG: DUF1501 domain-containing protein [Polyangiaceae bacterium]
MTKRLSFGRRSLLSGLGALALPRLAFAEAAPSARDKILVCVFLRGAVDGLSMVVPYEEASYYADRPNIAIPRPGKPQGALKLDARFGLHPRLAALKPAFDSGELALVHAVGSPHPTRSHFEAQDNMETASLVARRHDGWLARSLPSAPASETFQVPALAIGGRTPLALRGGAAVLSTPGLERFRLRTPPRLRDGIENAFADMYAGDTGSLADSGRGAIGASRALRELLDRNADAKSRNAYPRVVGGLADIALVIRENLGLRVAWLDAGGFDTHQDQGSSERGRLAPLLDGLAAGLTQFRRDVGDRFADVVVLVMSEFGRTVRENGTRGTDHGHGSVMFAFGGGVRGGKVYGSFPGLAPEQRYEGRDLAVTTDFRSVFAEVAQKQLGVADLSRVLPDFRASKTRRSASCADAAQGADVNESVFDAAKKPLSAAR